MVSGQRLISISLAVRKYLVTELLVPTHFAVFTSYLNCGDPVSHLYTEWTLTKCTVLEMGWMWDSAS